MKKDGLLESGYETIEGTKIDTLYKKFDVDSRGVYIFQFNKKEELVGQVYLNEEVFNKVVSGPWTKPNI